MTRSSETRKFHHVIPAQTGILPDALARHSSEHVKSATLIIRSSETRKFHHVIPACAGMTHASDDACLLVFHAESRATTDSRQG
ncbi:MAG: hypothetical protein RBR38_09665 [Desulfomicrobium apsheronum]|nr:hypothetical protein [Desulfomicrobium apsheronum]